MKCWLSALLALLLCGTTHAWVVNPGGGGGVVSGATTGGLTNGYTDSVFFNNGVTVSNAPISGVVTSGTTAFRIDYTAVATNGFYTPHQSSLTLGQEETIGWLYPASVLRMNLDVFRVETSSNAASKIGFSFNTPIQLIGYTDVPVSVQNSLLSQTSFIAIGYTNDVNDYLYLGLNGTNKDAAVYAARPTGQTVQGSLTWDKQLWLGWDGRTFNEYRQDGVITNTDIPANAVGIKTLTFWRGGLTNDPAVSGVSVGAISSYTNGVQLVSSNRISMAATGGIYLSGSLSANLLGSTNLSAIGLRITNAFTGSGALLSSTDGTNLYWRAP